MRITTPDDLAYGLKFALERARFDDPADRQRLQHLLTRWDHQQRTSAQANDDLIAALREALARAIFPSLQLKEQIKALLGRWEAAPDPGAAIVRQWNCDRDYFLKTLEQLDSEAIYRMAESAVAFHRQRGSDVTVDQQLAAWQAAAEAQQCAMQET